MNVESCSSAAAFLAMEKHEGPGCIVLDVRMPEMSGPELQEELNKGEQNMPIIFLSGHGDVPITAQAMKMGAADFLTKPVDRDVLIEAIHRSLAKDAENRERQAERKTAENRVKTLTPREHEVLTYVIAGLLNKQIAFELNIAEVTVKIHRGRAMRKLGCDSLPDLVRMCEKAGVIPAVPLR